MFGAGAIMVAAALLAPAVAGADAEDKPVVVEPGVYVVRRAGSSATAATRQKHGVGSSRRRGKHGATGEQCHAGAP